MEVLIKTEIGRVLESAVKGTFRVVASGWGETFRLMAVVLLVGVLALTACWMISNTGRSDPAPPRDVQVADP